MSLSRLAARRGGFQRGVGMAPEQVGALPQPGGLLVAAAGAPTGDVAPAGLRRLPVPAAAGPALGFGAQTGAAHRPLRPLPDPRATRSLHEICKLLPPMLPDQPSDKTIAIIMFDQIIDLIWYP
jgi:hypothetical protein